MERAWRLIGVPSYHNSFGDLRVITHSIPCEEAGIDPYKKDACNDFWQKNPQPNTPYQNILLNYPPIWLKLSKIGAEPSTTPIFGLAISALAALALVFSLSSKTRTGGAIIIATILSPSILLGFERGNIDLLIFSFLVLIIAISERAPERLQMLIQSLGIILLTTLKLFPVACITLLIKSRRNWPFAIITALLAISSAWLLADGKFASVLTNTPKPDNLAFGSLPAIIGLKKIATGLDSNVNSLSLPALALSAAAFLSIFMPTFIKKQKTPFENYIPIAQKNLNGNLALAGVSIYCIGFLFGASFDYRLIFLTLVLPLLISAYEDEESPSKGKRLIAPVTLVIFLWTSRVSNKIYYADELLDWGIFSIGSAWLAFRLFLQSNDKEKTAPESNI
jgi:hypothetical protein